MRNQTRSDRAASISKLGNTKSRGDRVGLRKSHEKRALTNQAVTISVEMVSATAESA